MMSGALNALPRPAGSRESRGLVLAVLCFVAMAVAGCVTAPPPGAPPPPAPIEEAPPPAPVEMLPQRAELPTYYRMRNTVPGRVPVRVALLLPFNSADAGTRGVADALERAAELALFDTGNTDILLMPRDDGGTPASAAAAAQKAIDDGAEIILGPLFAQNAVAVGPIAKARGVPVIAFSTDRSAGGNGVYLLSFQAENEVERIVAYAAKSGHNNFAALIPQSAYGDRVGPAFRQATALAGAAVTMVQPFPERAEAVGPPAAAVAKSGADAVLIAEGGVVLQAIGSQLALNGASNRTVKFLGTGLWDEAAVQREPMLQNGWFAAPSPDAWVRFQNRYRTAYNAAPPRIATLAYDAVSLVTVLSKGMPYQRFTPAALTDPNGFAGIDGIFRFRTDGSAERGLAVLQVTQDGFRVVDPAPTRFPAAGF